jgi:5-formyltetrahydrofolate cyclo-ligase
MNETRTTTTEKRKLRERMLAKRRAIPHAALAGAGKFIARHYADHPILAFAPSFAGYMAMQGEVDVVPILEHMIPYRKTTAMPCMTEQKNLLFRQWAPVDALQRHPTWQVQEPLPTAPTLIPAVILVPLVAFDADGYRLGYGAGYYDRTMEALRRFDEAPLFIGVAHSLQEVEQIPTEPHDQRLDGILTELGVSMF